MRCLDCKKKLEKEEEIASKDAFNVSLCSRHLTLMTRLMRLHATPREAIQLYYALKEADASPMLEWWDGSKSVDIALSRVKLNLEIDTEYQMFTCQQVLQTLEERMYSYKDGFTTIRIPHMLIRQCPKETVLSILAISEGLRAKSRAV